MDTNSLAKSLELLQSQHRDLLKTLDEIESHKYDQTTVLGQIATDMNTKYETLHAQVLSQQGELIEKISSLDQSFLVGEMHTVKLLVEALEASVRENTSEQKALSLRCLSKDAFDAVSEEVRQAVL